MSKFSFSRPLEMWSDKRARSLFCQFCRLHFTLQRKCSNMYKSSSVCMQMFMFLTGKMCLYFSFHSHTQTLRKHETLTEKIRFVLNEINTLKWVWCVQRKTEIIHDFCLIGIGKRRARNEWSQNEIPNFKIHAL